MSFLSKLFQKKSQVTDNKLLPKECLEYNALKNRFYGITTLVDVLCGSENEKIRKASLDSVEEYGKLKELKRGDVEAIIEWLIDNKFIRQTKGLYPVLHPTYEGTHYDESMTVTKLKKLKKYLEGDDKQ